MILDREATRNDLFGLVGFYSADNPNYPNLVPSLLESRSGRRFNEAHLSLLTIENIDQSMKNFSHFVYPAYSAATDAAGGYERGSKVSDSGKNYEYINAAVSSGNAPPDVTYWKQIDELSDYLIKAVYTGVDRLMDKWINDKKIRSKIKSIYDNVLLFNGIANYRDLEPNKNHFVGLRIRMKRGERSLATIINRLGHQFNAAFAGLPIRVYHSSQQDPIAQFNLDHTQGLSQQWTAFPSDQTNILRYISDDYEAGGDFYIGYKQSDLEGLGAQALRMDLDWTTTPCGECDSKGKAWWRQWSPFIEVMGFEVEESALGVGDTLFDPDLIGIAVTNNYGLNLNLSNKCDIGYFIKQEEDLFAEGLQNSVALVLLEAMAANTRGSNQVANQVRTEAKKEIFHFKGTWGTVRDKFEASIKGLEFDLSGLAEECFPCDDGYADVIAGTGTLR